MKNESSAVSNMKCTFRAECYRLESVVKDAMMELASLISTEVKPSHGSGRSWQYLSIRDKAATINHKIETEIRAFGCTGC